MDKNILTAAIGEAIEKSDGCCLCYLWTRDEERHMKYLLTNERSMDLEFRIKVLEAHGFCNRHMYLLYQTAYGHGTEDGLGYATYMQGVVEKVIKKFRLLPLDRMSELQRMARGNILSRRKEEKKFISTLANLAVNVVREKLACPACEYLGSSAQIHVNTFIRMLDDGDFAEAFLLSNGLCLPHFAAAMRSAQRSRLKSLAKIAQVLIKNEIKYLQMVECHLSEFIRKKSYDFRDEPRGEEVNANAMALRLLAGAEGLYNPKEY